MAYWPVTYEEFDGLSIQRLKEVMSSIAIAINERRRALERSLILFRCGTGNTWKEWPTPNDYDGFPISTFYMLSAIGAMNVLTAELIRVYVNSELRCTLCFTKTPEGDQNDVWENYDELLDAAGMESLVFWEINARDPNVWRRFQALLDRLVYLYARFEGYNGFGTSATSYIDVPRGFYFDTVQEAWEFLLSYLGEIFFEPGTRRLRGLTMIYPGLTSPYDYLLPNKIYWPYYYPYIYSFLCGTRVNISVTYAFSIQAYHGNVLEQRFRFFSRVFDDILRPGDYYRTLPVSMNDFSTDYIMPSREEILPGIDNLLYFNIPPDKAISGSVSINVRWYAGEQSTVSPFMFVPPNSYGGELFILDLFPLGFSDHGGAYEGISKVETFFDIRSALTQY